MASFTLVSSVPKFGHIGSSIAKRRSWNPKVFSASTPRSVQITNSHPEASPSTDAVKQGANDAIKGAENVKDKAYSTAEHASEKTKNAVGRMSASAQDISEKAKQTMQEAWGSAKDTAQKAKDTVLGKAEESKECAKANAEAVKRSMNTKN
ncbi:putative Late embryogenesis abundant protein family protein [Quillaja saponaria]|uniref:Late embryogenesis abundant protein family protein n=1 Tax=Quillaja saponaria TaxID=32244 RepID=A0AAD7QB24_QUISA|nr:putative Late embryogenesis abundant protein family protein [Quillaja saponaria]